MVPPDEDINLEAILPLGLKHRNSAEDLIDIALALDSGDEDEALRELFNRWYEEDEKTREQQAKDKQMADIAKGIREIKSAQSNAAIDPAIMASLTAVKEFAEKAKTLSIPLPPYMTKKELANFLKVAEKTVDKLVKQAILPEPKTISENTGANARGRKIHRWKTDEVIKQIDQY